MISGDCAKVSEGHDIHKTIRKVTLVSIRLPPERFSSNVLFQKFTTKLSHHSRQPRITARGGVTRNSGISQAPGCPAGFHRHDGKGSAYFSRTSETPQ